MKAVLATYPNRGLFGTKQVRPDMPEPSILAAVKVYGLVHDKTASLAPVQFWLGAGEW